jgi:DNA-binding transcriptional ArsR family regulator
MLEVEDVFSSYGRAKVISVMMESNELNISEITRRSGISHSSVESHLAFLVKAGLITEKRFNRIRIFKVNHSSPRAAVLQRFLADWRSVAAAPAAEMAFN